jgi:N6-L-threonylcarbamoyladenine synthase
MKDGKFITLGIESSCDETAAAVTADGRFVLSNIISSQIDIHKVFGGVVPEIASRHHLTQINGVIDEALAEAGVSFDDVDLIGVTEGPGLVGAVLIGVSTAKALAFASGKPLCGVHHIKGHVCAALLKNIGDTRHAVLTPRHAVRSEAESQYPALDLNPPFLALVISGGHTDLIDVKSIPNMEVIGRTRDDAIGEAYDKVARVLGLGYPGGPKVEALAREGNPYAVNFKRVMLEDGSLDFSFSGTKTGVMNYVNSERQAGREINSADVAASFQQTVSDVVVAKTMSALEITGRDKLVIGGGVASNGFLRGRLAEACAEKGVQLYLPPPILCTDNAAMIACVAYYEYKAGKVSGLDLDAEANLAL